jgi:cell division protein FtsI (penicillin-binding protein 3)
VAEAKKSLHPKEIYVVVAEPKNGKILALNGDVGGKIFEPGSTFKPVVVAGAFEKGVITPKTKINCENGRFLFQGKVIKDHRGYGALTVEEILEKSSNIGTAKIGLMFSDRDFFQNTERFGFGRKTGIAVSGEIPGIVISPDKWDGLTKARNSFGQSIAVTPIQLAMAYCALANGGKLMRPVIGEEKPAVMRRVCSYTTANRVKNALKRTVSDDGTAPLARVEGVDVGGKTGTAQAVHPNGYYAPDRFWTEFAGFFPLDHPKYVVVVIVEEADLPAERNYGGLVAAPIFSKIAGKISKLN